MRFLVFAILLLMLAAVLAKRYKRCEDDLECEGNKLCFELENKKYCMDHRTWERYKNGKPGLLNARYILEPLSNIEVKLEPFGKWMRKEYSGGDEFHEKNSQIHVPRPSQG